MRTIYRAWRLVQDNLLGYTAACVMLGATLLAVLEIFRRYVEGRTFYWGQDAVTYFLTAAAFLYFGVSQAKRTHLAVTALPDWLRGSGRPRLAYLVRATASFLSLLFVAGFIWWGLPAAERTMSLGRMTSSMIIPLWPFQYVLLIGVGALGITLLFQFYREVWLLFGRDPFPEDADHEEFEL